MEKKINILSSEITLLCNLITEIALMKVYNRTTLPKECRVKLKRKCPPTYADGMRPSFLLILACLPMSDIVRQCAHVSF